MANYQASVGLRLFYAAASNMASATEIPGVTDTPQKGGEPEDITLNIISEKFVRHVNGQQDLGQMTYSFVPDFTASIGSVAKVTAALAASKSADQWFYEEYVEGTDSTSGSTTTHTNGAGVLYKGKVTGMALGEQSGNSAQTAQFFVQLTGESIYICSGGESPTYTDLFTGASVSNPA